MNITAILSGLGLAGSALGSLFGKKYKDTDYAKLLKRYATEGVYSGSALANIMGGVGRETGNVAQQTKTALQGRLISQGMGGSIAGQRSITNVDTERMSQLRRAIQDIQMQNEQLKAQYGLQYAQGAMQEGQQQQGALSELMGVSGSLLYNELNPPTDYMKLFSAMNETPNPYPKPEVPLAAPSSYVMPKTLNSETGGGGTPTFSRNLNNPYGDYQKYWKLLGLTK